MPVSSDAQRRFMFAVKAGDVPSVKPTVGTDFLNASRGITGLPKRLAAPARKFLGVRKPTIPGKVVINE